MLPFRPRAVHPTEKQRRELMSHFKIAGSRKFLQIVDVETM